MLLGYDQLAQISESSLQKAIIKEASTQSPFSNLPAELRNRIYEYVEWDHKDLRVKNDRFSPNRGLLLTCRTTRREYLPIYEYIVPCAARRHTLEIYTLDFSCTLKFLNSLTLEQRKAMRDNRSLYVRITVDRCFKDKDASLNSLRQWTQTMDSDKLLRDMAKRPCKYKSI